MKLLVAKTSERAAHMLGADARHAANDGDLTAEDLVAIDAQFTPRFARTPEHDLFGPFGARTGIAWLDTATGATRHFCTSYDPNARRWLHIDDVEGRERINGGGK